MHSPRVSVIMPAYNHEAFVQEAIASVLAQSVASLELRIHDDGSTDGTRAQLERAAAQDARIVLTHGPNQGLGPTLGRLARESRGELVAICASDDVWHVDRLAWAIADLADHPEASATFADHQNIDASGAAYDGPLALSHPPAEPQALVARMCRGNCLSLSAAVARRDAVLAAGTIPPDLVQVPDYALWMSLLADGTLHVRPQQGAKHRVHAGSLSHQDPHRAIAETIRCIEAFAGPIMARHVQGPANYDALHGRLAHLSHAVGDHERTARHLSTKIKHSGLDEHESLLFLQSLMHLRHDRAAQEYRDALQADRPHMAPDHQALFDQLSSQIGAVGHAD
jgi:hypothetical protein